MASAKEGGLIVHIDPRDPLEIIRKFENRDSTYLPKLEPLVLDRAKGSLVWDTSGKRYIDFCAGFGALPLGHNHDALQMAAANRSDAIQHGMGDVYPSIDKVQLLSKLAEISPFKDPRISLAISGSQAVEIALKTAMLFSKAIGIIVFENAYHGVDLGVLPVTHRQDFRSPFLSWLKTDQVEFLPFGADVELLIAAAERLISKGFGLAAVMVEPIQGRAGVIVPPEGWLKSLRSFCNGYDALLILDEIFCGLGRTGRLSFAEECQADLVCWGKALGGGMPISACIGSSQVMEAWPQSQGEAIHTGTFFGHPLSCRIAAATLQEIQSQNLCAKAKEDGCFVKEELSKRLQIDGKPIKLTGEGLMLAIHFEQSGKGAQLMDKLRVKGLIALASGSRGESLSITPALNIGSEILEEGLGIIVDAVKQRYV
jgi:acetylornithine/succinyldiaminopimelate/putrescine aminotransferase